MASAGQLLRMLKECELFHIESALASLQQDKNRIISETLLKDNGDMLKSTTEVRALTLSDNKRIARLQAALKLIVDAYEAQHDKESDGECNVNQNVLQTVAGAVMMQSLSDCSASKTSGCFWGPQGTKMQFLLDWMINYENDRASSTRDYIRQLLLEWIQPAAEKKHQLAACLALLEFLQRHRCKFEISSRSSTISCLVGDRTEIFMNALQAVVDRGTIRVANSPCVKLSKLALIALEALVLLSGDIAAKYLTSDEAAKKELAQGDLMRLTVESINFVLHVLRRWHSHSMHRRFLVAAVEHLQSYASPCKIILKNGVGHESPSNICLNVTTALNVLSWHWVASVPVFCTRIDVFIRVQKISLSENFSRVLKKVIYEATMDGSYDTNTPAEVMYAQLRYVCLVMDSVGREKGCYKVLEESSQEIKTAFVVVFTHSLSLASRNGAEGTIRLILRVFRTVFLTGERLQLLSSQDEEQELLSQLLRIHDSAVEAKGNSDGLSQCLDELEFFLADYVISRDLFITEILRRLQDAYTQCDLRIVSFVQIFLYQLDKQTTQNQLHDHWRKLLTRYVAGLIAHENRDIRRLVISCTPYLDPVSCIAELLKPEIHGAAITISTSTLAYLFASSTRCSLEVMVSWFIDACQFGTVQKHSDADVMMMISPYDWYDYVKNSSESVQEVTTKGDIPNQIFLLGFGPNGLCSHFKSVNTRKDFLRVLLQKLFGSPRNATLFRMLRELVMCGWIEIQVCEMLEKQLTAHMVTLPRLSEDILDDNSFSAVKTIEGLMFAWLAPLLVLRMLPHDVFDGGRVNSLLCGREDLDHLTKYIERQNQLGDSSNIQVDTTKKTLFHILARSIVDPVEFKEVKMIATECLSKFYPVQVLPFVLAYLFAFIREANFFDGVNCSSIVDEKSVPDECGLVNAKLMVYYLNLVFSGDIHNFKDPDIMLEILVMLIQLLRVPCVDHSDIKRDDSSFMDLQRGCIECIALLLIRLSEDNKEQKSTKEPDIDVAAIMNLLMDWIFGQAGTDNMKKHNDRLNSRVQELLHGMWSKPRHYKLPLPVRLHLCSALLSAISKASHEVLTKWKKLKFISSIALATKSCSEDDIVLESLQMMILFLNRASDVLSAKDTDDLQLIRACFEATAASLKTTECESTVTNGLNVVKVIIDKFPGLIETFELQHLIKRYTKSISDRQVSPVIRELAQSLVQTTVPP